MNTSRHSRASRVSSEFRRRHFSQQRTSGLKVAKQVAVHSPFGANARRCSRKYSSRFHCDNERLKLIGNSTQLLHEPGWLAAHRRFHGRLGKAGVDVNLVRGDQYQYRGHALVPEGAVNRRNQVRRSPVDQPEVYDRNAILTQYAIEV